MWLLDRLGHDGQVLNVEELSVVGQPLVAPGLEYYLQPLEEAITILRLGNPEAGEVLRQRSAADPKLNPAVADHVQCRDLLCHPYRMRQREQDDRDTQPQRPRSFRPR